MSGLLALRDVAIGYGRRPVLAGINLTIARGDFWGVVGPNGAGKTTLVKTMLRVIPPIAGVVERAPGLTLGYVPQRGVIDDIFPLSAGDVVLMGRYPRVGLLRRVGRAERERALGYMEHVGIAALASRPFRALSGGQKQRVLIARGLATEPDLLALDEPTDGMDLAGEHGIMEVIAGLHRSGRTIVMITHTLNLAANYATDLMVINGDEGLFRAGRTAELLTGETLEGVYHVGVDVHALGGRTIVVARSRTARPGKARPWSS